MKIKIHQSKEEINSIGGISLIGGLYNSQKSVKKADSMQASKIRTGKLSTATSSKQLPGCLRSVKMIMPIVTKTDCKNQVNWLKISQSINKKVNP